MSDQPAQELPAKPTGRVSIFYGWWIVVVGTLTMMLAGGILFYTFGIFLVALNRHFLWSIGQISLASFLYFLVAGLSGPFIGRAIQRFGVRSVLSAAVFSAGAVLFLLSQVNALWQLYLLYVILGVFYAGCMQIPINTLVTNWFEQRRGLAIGIAMNGIGVGGALMPPFAQWLIDRAGWSVAYAVLGVLLWLIILPSVLIVVKNKPQDLALLPDGDPSRARGKRPESAAAAAQAIALRPSLATTAFWLIALAYFFTQIANFGTLIHLPKFLTEYGFDTGTAAIALSVTALFGAVGKMGFGALADHVGNRRFLFITTCVMTSVGLVLFLNAHAIGMVGLAATIFGLGMGGNFTLQAVVVAEVFGVADYASIFGALTSAGVLGGAVGPMVAGSVFDLTQSYQWSFAFFIVSFVLSIACMAPVRPLRQNA